MLIKLTGFYASNGKIGRKWIKLPSRNLLAQSQQWKQQNNVWNLFKVNNNFFLTLNHFTQCSGVSIAVDFEQMPADSPIDLTNPSLTAFSISFHVSL